MAGRGARAPGVSVSLTDFDPAGEDKVLAAMCYPYLNLPEQQVDSTCRRPRARRAAGAVSRRTSATAPIAATVPAGPWSAQGTGSTSWRTTGPSGTFSGTGCSPSSGSRSAPTSASRCPNSSRLPAFRVAFVESLERSKSLHDALAPYFPEQSAYAVALAFNIRFVLQLSAREAMHVLELRSSPQGHPAYRRIVQEMHRLIGEVAGHRAIADSMCFVDHSEIGLGRLEAEQRSEAKRSSAPD